MAYKKISQIRTAASPHMVGDGFRVRNFISSDLWEPLSPFLMLDYMIPWELLPTKVPRGVGVHPHKGFETVTILWEGALAHEDSSGGKGQLYPGDVQWMTAGNGILHKEFHEKEFSLKGGTLHGAQLWVNLPAQYKSVPPAYQDISAAKIPELLLPDEKGRIRIIAGELDGIKGPAHTFTRINIFDIHAAANAHKKIVLPEGDNTAVLVLKGTVMLNDAQLLRTGEMAILSSIETDVELLTNNESHLLILSGEPIDEPIAAYGPFVMNTQEEIREAFRDFELGKFGVLH